MNMLSRWFTTEAGRGVIAVTISVFLLDDHARVKLKAEINPSRTDFINASTIVSTSSSASLSSAFHTLSFFLFLENHVHCISNLEESQRLALSLCT